MRESDPGDHPCMGLYGFARATGPVYLAERSEAAMSLSRVWDRRAFVLLVPLTALAGMNGNGPMPLNAAVQFNFGRREDDTHEDSVSGLVFLDGGDTLVSGSLDRTLKIRESREGRCARTVRSRSNWIMRLSASPDGRAVAAANWDGTVSLWDTADWTVTTRLRGHTRAVMCVAYSPDGRLLASCGRDQTVRLWERAAGGRVRVLAGHKHWVQVVAFSRDGRLLASGDLDGEIRVWNTETGEPVAVVDAHTYQVLSLAFSPDGRRLASGAQGRDAALAVWDTAEWRREAVLLWGDRSTRGLIFLSDDRLISAGNDNVIRFWDLESKRQTHAIMTHDSWITAMALSPSGTRLATGSGDGFVHVLRLDSAKPIEP